MRTSVLPFLSMYTNITSSSSTPFFSNSSIICAGVRVGCMVKEIVIHPSAAIRSIIEELLNVTNNNANRRHNETNSRRQQTDWR